MVKREPKESEIQQAIIEYLHTLKIYCWRNNTTGVYSEKAGCFIKSGQGTLKGVSDILGILPDGRFLAIEVKRPKKLPTTEQSEFIRMINRNGGIAFVATSIDNVIKKSNHYIKR